MNQTTPRVAIGTSQDNFRMVGSGLASVAGGSLSNGGQYCIRSALPTEFIATSGLTTGPNVISIAGIAPATLGQLAFVIGDAAAETATARVWGGKPIVRGSHREFKFTPLLDLSLVAGTTGWNASSIFPEPAGVPLLFVDAITVSTDWTRNDSSKVWGEFDNDWAVVDFDMGGACALIIEIVLGTAARCGVYFSEF